MLNDYIKFDVEKFIKDFDINKGTLRSLKDQLNEMSEVRGHGNEPKVQTTPKPDGLENYSIMKMQLKAKITDLENYFDLYYNAYDCLTDEEKTIFNAFYRQHSKNPVITLSMALNIEKSEIYRRRDKMLNKMEKIIFG